MSNKELALNIVNRLPSDISLHEVAREIEFVAAIKDGFDEIDRGEGVPIEEVEKMIDLWATK